jgi:hypothetical protein
MPLATSTSVTMTRTAEARLKKALLDVGGDPADVVTSK